MGVEGNKVGMGGAAASIELLRERKRVRDAVKGCRSCGLYAGCSGPVPWVGATPSGLVVIGEAPGEEEDERGEPFVGKSGQYLKLIMEECGLRPGEFSFVNVVSCYPKRTPTKEEVALCKENLTAQLALLQPAYCLVLGGVALGAWWPTLRITEARGVWWRLAGERLMNPAMALATWHPAAVLRRPSLEKELRLDLDFFKLVSQEEIPPPMQDKCLKCGAGADKWLGDWGYCDKHHPVTVAEKGGGRRSKEAQSQKSQSPTAEVKPKRRGMKKKKKEWEQGEMELI